MLSLGVSHKGSVHTLFCTTNIDAHRKSCQRIQHQYKDLNLIDTESLCPLSTYVVHSIFVMMKDLIHCIVQCISKRVDSANCIVSYNRCSFKVNRVTPSNHDLSLAQRLR